MTKQKEYEKQRDALLKSIEELKISTLRDRVLEMIEIGRSVDSLEGSPVSRIPHSDLNLLLRGVMVQNNTESFVRFCREKDIPIKYETASGGDEFSGHWSHPKNILLKIG